MSENAVAGAGRCPKCASRKVVRADWPGEGEFYARTLEVCANCKAVWEPFDPAQLLDPHLPKTISFREPCDNCAFRPGSVEQSDPAKWAELMASLKTDGRFYCHKGVPLDPGGKDGFAYPQKPISTELCPGHTMPDVKKLRMCRGWLTMWGARMAKHAQNA